MAHPGPYSSSHRDAGALADAEPIVAAMNMGTLRNVLLVRIGNVVRDERNRLAVRIEEPSGNQRRPRHQAEAERNHPDQIEPENILRPGLFVSIFPASWFSHIKESRRNVCTKT